MRRLYYYHQNLLDRDLIQLGQLSTASGIASPSVSVTVALTLTI